MVFELKLCISNILNPIDWKVKQGIVDGDRYALLDYTNNTPYTITHFELTFEEKDDLKDEDKEKFYKHIKDVVNADDEGMEEIKNKKIEFYAKSNRIVNKISRIFLAYFLQVLYSEKCG